VRDQISQGEACSGILQRNVWQNKIIIRNGNITCGFLTVCSFLRHCALQLFLFLDAGKENIKSLSLKKDFDISNEFLFQAKSRACE
jgi:hypothetical protein